VDELAYERLAGTTFKRVIDLFEDIDPDEADVDSSGDVVRIELKDGRRVVLNTQRPVRQIWLAGGQAAWHFSYDAESERWLDDKGRGELFEVLGRIVLQMAGLRLPIS
jgi:CyaY protein